MKLENPGKQLAPPYKSYSKEKESTMKPIRGNEDCQLKESLFQLDQGKLFCRRDLIFL